MQLRVVVGRRGVIGEPRGDFSSALVPELLEVQLARAAITLPGDFFTGFLLVPVLLLVREDESQQKVVTKPCRSRVTRE